MVQLRPNRVADVSRKMQAQSQRETGGKKWKKASVWQR